MCSLQEFQNTEKQPVPCCKVYVIIYWLILAVEPQKWCVVTYSLYTLNIPHFCSGFLSTSAFQHYDSPKDKGQNAIGGQSTAPEPQAAPLQFLHGSHTRICPVIGSRAVLAQGCPVIQIPCYEKAEASRASWGQTCHVALDSSCRLSSAQTYNAKWDTRGTHCYCKSSVSQSLTSSPSSTQIWVCSL